jgi:osmotically-inducible protein OsmY
MKTAELTQEHVLEELAWDPEVNSANIGVTVTGGGIVRLSGEVGSYAEKIAAEKAARRIAGVHAVVDDLNVKLLPGGMLPDEKIAQAAINALVFNVAVPGDKVTITVQNGWITLAGAVPWFYQRRAAEEAVRYLRGVKGIINLITVEEKPDQANIQERIEQAYERSAELDAKFIMVDVQDGNVTLKGTVSSWPEWKQAEAAAWAAPGAKAVTNLLRIDAPVWTTW